MKLTRTAVHQYPSGLIVSLDQFLVSARNTVNVKLVLGMMDKYPVQLKDAYLRSRTIECGWEVMRPETSIHTFIFPADITRNMDAVIKTAYKEQTYPDQLEGRIKNQGAVLDLVASIDPKFWKFSRAFPGLSTTFYAVKNKLRSWLEDRKWLEQDWLRVEADVDLFGLETETSGLSWDAVYERHQTLANEVIAKFATSPLSLEFATPSGKGLISFDNIVGGVCNGWLKTVLWGFYLEYLAGVMGGCYVLLTLTTSVGWPRTPAIPICFTKVVLQSVNMKANHCGIIVAQLHYVEATHKLLVFAYMYEPLIDDDYRDDMENVWNGVTNGEKNVVQEGLRRFVERWQKSSQLQTCHRSN
ncbi:Hypothetical protein PHPALM_17574 [Phytophthora palmivora]|uniref:Uncharacterized protein n=1 Tax=Phytophthora palmivora TaxID=4796 RepID=A0A2P4XM21_9STRA|nr:Hypothetical protein PHPALM_17574 [Phytophthora palmivora]